MSDATKRKWIHFLNRFDALTSKISRNNGWNATSVLYDKYDDGDELMNMTGDELSRELVRQIIAAVPLVLVIVVVVLFVVFAVKICGAAKITAN